MTWMKKSKTTMETREMRLEKHQLVIDEHSPMPINPDSLIFLVKRKLQEYCVLLQDGCVFLQKLVQEKAAEAASASRVEFGRVDVLIADLGGVGDDGRIGNLLEKTQCERGDISQTRRIYFSNRRMDKSKPLEEIRTSKHPPWYGINQFKERVTLTFLENQKGLFHNL